MTDVDNIDVSDIEEFVIKFPNNIVVDKEKTQEMLSRKISMIMDREIKITILDNPNHIKTIKTCPLTNLIMNIFPHSQIIYYSNKDGMQ